MFPFEKIGLVNLNQVLQYQPETLLIIRSNVVSVNDNGWNKVWSPAAGQFLRVVDSKGRPPYEPVVFTEEEMKDVYAERTPRPKLPPRLRLG